MFVIWNFQRLRWVVEECCVRVEAVAVRHRGQHTSKNVGISNKYRGENPLRRKSKVSRATTIVPGLVDPNPDAQGYREMENTVDIP